MKNMIKVAWDNGLARRNLTGTGVYAARLLEQLERMEGLRVEVLPGWTNGVPASAVDRRLHTVGHILWMQTSLRRALRKGKFDLLHCPAFIAPRKAPCPVVITMHDVTYLSYPEGFAWWWVRFLRATMPAATRAAAAILCGSECSRRDIVEAYSLSPGRVHVVPYGVDHGHFFSGAALNATWASGLGIRGGYVLHVGELSRRKNIPTLLRAVALLRAKGRWGARQLVLAGSRAPGMPGASEVYDSIRQLELGESVILAGRVPQEHLPGLYAHAALLVMPSWYEGFGFPVVEAMASGTPVICSNISSLPEVAGDAGILVAPADADALASAMTDVLEHPGLADELRRKGLAQAQRFDWKRTAEATYQVYQTALQ